MRSLGRHLFDVATVLALGFAYVTLLALGSALAFGRDCLQSVRTAGGTLGSRLRGTNRTG